MSFAVRLDSAPQALHRRLRNALVAFALATSSFALAFAEPAARGWIALAALACFALAFGRRRLVVRAGRVERSRRRLPAWLVGALPASGSLCIDDGGRARWIGTPGSAEDASAPSSRSSATPRLDGADAAARPVRIERWNVLGPFAWLRLRADDSREPIDVLLACKGTGARKAGTADDDDWRRLRTWLLWYGRGGTPADALSGGARTRQ